MSEMLKKYGGLILFYGIIVLGIVLLNERCRYLNEQKDTLDNLAITKIAYQNEGGEKHV